ncbi:MAG: hypothetical protein M2R45_04177 [Verrucomicrobia subdivision 3 bacterium]|nr:hypothetical protein [Limisphaerales bacterium]MCS1413018.1 hypothetical protein [Limisphaerales bacterium]
MKTFSLRQQITKLFIIAAVLIAPAAANAQCKELSLMRSGSISNSGDSENYYLTVQCAGTIWAYTEYTGDETDTYGRLYDNNGNELTRNDDGGTGHNFNISHEVTAGTYYVKVNHYCSIDTSRNNVPLERSGSTETESPPDRVPPIEYFQTGVRHYCSIDTGSYTLRYGFTPDTTPTQIPSRPSTFPPTPPAPAPIAREQSVDEPSQLFEKAQPLASRSIANAQSVGDRLAIEYNPPNNLCLLWDGVEGNTYKIEAALSLIAPQWTTLKTVTAASTGRIRECFNHSDAICFFRLIVTTVPPTTPTTPPTTPTTPVDTSFGPFDEQPFAALAAGLHEAELTIDLTGTSVTPSDVAGVFLEKTPAGNLAMLSVKDAGENQVEIIAKTLVKANGERLPTTGPPYNPPLKNGEVQTIRHLQRTYDWLKPGSGSGRTRTDGFRSTGVQRINQAVVNRWNEEIWRVLAQIARSGMHNHMALMFKYRQEIDDALAAGQLPAPDLLDKFDKQKEGILLQGNRLTAVHTALYENRLVNRALPYFGTGAVLFAVWGNSGATAERFEAAFRDYARDLERGEDTVGSVAILAAVCNDLAPGAGNIVLDVLL